MRLFVAVEIPESIRDYMGIIQKELMKAGADVKWVNLKNYHFTVKFLGEVEDRLLPSIEQALSLAAESSMGFSISLQGLGFFPNQRRPRVLWAGVRGETEPMLFLGDRVDAYLSSLNFSPENKRDYHLTLGRIRSERNSTALTELAARLSPDLYTASFRIDKFYLMESILSSAGPTYLQKKDFVLQ